MANKILWEEDGATSLTTILSTDLNALADGTLSAVSSEVDNTTALDMLCWFELVTGTLQDAAVAGQMVDIHQIQSIDGTNYEEAPVTGGANSPPPICSFQYKAATTARRHVKGPFQFNPYKMKYYVDNRCGGQFAATGNTLKISTQGPEVQ